MSPQPREYASIRKLVAHVALDPPDFCRLRDEAERLDRSQSWVLREAFLAWYAQQHAGDPEEATP